MLCNLIAWKEGDEYVFEDGSKAYKFPDNDKRFKNFELIPDWVVEGLVGTPFRQFGFKSGKLYIAQLGVFTRSEFESEISKYKVENLDRYIDKRIRLDDGTEVTLKERKGFRFKFDDNNFVDWVHVKDVINKHYVRTSTGTEMIDIRGRIYKYVRYSGSLLAEAVYNGVVEQTHVNKLYGSFDFDVVDSADNLVTIMSPYLFEDREFYYKGYTPCKIVEFKSYNHSPIVKLLETGEIQKVQRKWIFSYTELSNIIKGKYCDVKVLHIQSQENGMGGLYTVQFPDGSISEVDRDLVRSNCIVHKDVADASSIANVRIKDYNYENGKWVVTSCFGVLEKDKFIDKCLEYSYFTDALLGNVFTSSDGHEYKVIEIVKSGGQITYKVVFDTGQTRILYSADMFLNNVTYHDKPRKTEELYGDWSDSLIGMRFRVIEQLKHKVFKIEFETGNINTASSYVIKSGSVLPSFIEYTKSCKVLGHYNGEAIKSGYYDRVSNLLVLLLKCGDILMIDKDGKLVSRESRVDE